jgi:hypothetical protein
MKSTLTLTLWTLALTVAVAAAAPDPAELAVARDVKLYIAKEHQARRSNPQLDFAKLHRLCGTSQQWTKGCRFWKATSGKDKFMFQVRPKGKIYGIPSMFR